MNKGESNRMVQKLRGLFPKMTPEQQLSAAKKFDFYDSTDVDLAIDKLSETKNEYSLPALLMFIREEMHGSGKVGANKGPEDYIAVLREDAASRFPGKRDKIFAMRIDELVMRVTRGWYLDATDFLKYEPSESRKRAIRREAIEMLVGYASYTFEKAALTVENMLFSDARHFGICIDEIAGVTIPTF